MSEGRQGGYTYKVRSQPKPQGLPVWNWMVIRERDGATIAAGESFSEAGAKGDALTVIINQPD